MTALNRVSKFRDFWDPIVLKIPLFGTLAMRAAVARFSRTLSTLVSSGVPLLTGFEICAKVISNRALKKSVEKAALGVSEGKSIVDGLSSTGHFPPMVIHMIGIGEVTGRLDELLLKVADIYDDEVDNAVDAITSLVQPLLIMAVGGIILFLMIAMYMPIFNLGDKLSAG
jgi:type IV pilus assembly protein PilC